MVFDPQPTPAENNTTHKEVSPKESNVLGLAFAMELGYTIALPAVLFGVGGAYVDKYLGTSHYLFFFGLAFAFFVSFTAIFRKIRIIMARMPKDLPKKKKHPIDPEIAKEQEILHDLFRPKE